MFFNWIAILISIPILWLLQNIIHELSHGLTRKVGWDWDFKIWPFPSNRLGRFTFAHVKYSRNSYSEEINNKGMALVSIMPKFSNLIFILISGTLLYFHIGPAILLSILAVFTLCNYIDAMVGTLGIFINSKKDSKSDIWRFQRYLKLDIPKMRIVMAIILVLLSGFVWGSIIPYFFLGA